MATPNVENEDVGPDADTERTLGRPGPVVVWANWYRFRTGERIHYSHVASVCLIWTARGRGTIVSAGTEFDMSRPGVLVLPWMHEVDYRPADNDPMEVGTIHIVPRHDGGVDVEPRVPFLDGDPLMRAPARSGLGGPRSGFFCGRSTPQGRGLAELGAFCVDRFMQGFDAALFGALGAVLLHEVGRSQTAVPVPDALGLTTQLRVITDRVRSDLTGQYTVSDLAAIGRCSTATVERLFTTETGFSAMAWVRQQRMRRAAELLRGTGMRISEVARAVGYQDPLYFSRVFRATFGSPPSRYARDLIRP